MLGLVSAESVHHFVRSSLGPLTMFNESGLTPRLSGELCVSLFRRLSANPLNRGQWNLLRDFCRSWEDWCRCRHTSIHSHTNSSWQEVSDPRAVISIRNALKRFIMQVDFYRRRLVWHYGNIGDILLRPGYDWYRPGG
jgi:hypothetical protein